MCAGGRLRGRRCPPGTPCGTFQFFPPTGRRSEELVDVPLVGVNARVVIRDFIAETVLIQRYENKEQNPIEVCESVGSKCIFVLFQS